MMVSKGVTLFSQTAIFNKDIREWICQTNDQKTWLNYKMFTINPIVIRGER